jgi:F-type H+-transporting ATPase subunit b
MLIAAANLIAQLGQEETPVEEEPSILLPEPQELFWGALAFAVLFFFLVKFVFPRINETLEQRRRKIQGDLEKAEEARKDAQQELTQYREQLSGARDEANRIIEEARKTAESMRRDMASKAEQESQGIVARAQEEIRAERDRVFQELKAQVGELSVELAARVVGESLDKDRQLRLVDDYIEELSGMPSGNGMEKKKDE